MDKSLAATCLYTVTASYRDVSLSMKMCAQRKAGRKQRAPPAVYTLPMVPCGSSPVTRVSCLPLRWEKRSAWGGGCLNSMTFQVFHDLYEPCNSVSISQSGLSKSCERRSITLQLILLDQQGQNESLISSTRKHTAQETQGLSYLHREKNRDYWERVWSTRQ